MLRLWQSGKFLLTSTKMRFFEDIVITTTAPTPASHDEYEDPREIRTLKVNRIKKDKTVFEQVSLRDARCELTVSNGRQIYTPFVGRCSLR